MKAATTAGGTDATSAMATSAAHVSSRSPASPQNADTAHPPAEENTQSAASTQLAIVGMAGETHQPDERSDMACTTVSYRAAPRAQTSVCQDMSG
ncbi:hypothetical protein Acsp04_23070 [Actinomadura sp. NBRC 104425]|nr:hypothetical protein Acsp04_23070 [Actinomadura sp. NBRC 104425]